MNKTYIKNKIDQVADVPKVIHMVQIKRNIERFGQRELFAKPNKYVIRKTIFSTSKKKINCAESNKEAKFSSG